MSDRAKIRARRVTGNDSQQQREIATAIKNAREMALLPYASRVTRSRTSGATGATGAGPTACRRFRRVRRPTVSEYGEELRRGDRGRRGFADFDVDVDSRGGRGVKVILRDDIDGVGKRGDICRRRRRLRPQPAPAQGPRHQGVAGAATQAASMRRAGDVRDAADRSAAQDIAPSWCRPASR